MLRVEPELIAAVESDAIAAQRVVPDGPRHLSHEPFPRLIGVKAEQGGLDVAWNRGRLEVLDDSCDQC